MHWPAARRRLRTFADLDLRVVNMHQNLAEVAHVEPFAAAGAFHEMIGLGFGEAVRLDAAIFNGFRH